MYDSVAMPTQHCNEDIIYCRAVHVVIVANLRGLFLLFKEKNQESGNVVQLGYWVHTLVLRRCICANDFVVLIAMLLTTGVDCNNVHSASVTRRTPWSLL